MTERLEPRTLDTKIECSDAVRDELFTSLHSKFRSMAARRLSTYGYTLHLEPHDVVNELYLRLHKSRRSRVFAGRPQLLAFIGTVFDSIVIDKYRESKRLKRHRDGLEVRSRNVDPAAPLRMADHVVCREALARLGERDPRQRTVIEMRYLSGLSVHEVAALLQVSPMTVKRDCASGIANLRKFLKIESS